MNYCESLMGYSRWSTWYIQGFWQGLAYWPSSQTKALWISGQIFGLTSPFFSNWWLWVILDGKSSQEYPVNVEFFKALFLVLHFSYYTLMTFLMMLSVILLSMLMIILCTICVIRHLICGNNYNWLLNLNLIYKKLWTGAGSGLLISILEKLNWFPLARLIKLAILIWKWMGLFLEKNNLLWCWSWLCLLNWIGALTLSLLLKLPPRSLDSLHEASFSWGCSLSIRPCMEYYCHVWDSAPSCYLELLDKLQKGICRTIGPSLAASLELLSLVEM